ncbi:MAG: rhodanese-like domain-containing protein [candidate division Zixibacteria bacterium]
MDRTNNSRSKLTLVLALFLIFCILVISGCQEEDNLFREKKRSMISEAKSAVGSVTVDELAEMMNNDDEFTIIDIRTKDEFTPGHLKGSVWIARGMLEFKAGQGQLKDFDKKYILYCRVDSRSALAAKTLVDMGYRDVSLLKGGFSAWCEAGYSIYNRHGEMVVKSFEQDETE